MTEKHTKEISYQEYKTEVLEDYRIAVMSRESQSSILVVSLWIQMRKISKKAICVGM